MHELIQWLVATIGSLGYLGIFVLMAIESSAFPFPSEVIMIPAGYLVHTGEMSMMLVILCGTAGSLAGSYVNYIAARYLGRPLLLKYGKYVFLTEQKFARAETFFRKHGEVSTFVGRLLPGVRQIISLPAGLAGMSLARFSSYTLFGAGLWITVLSYIGFVIGANEELVKTYSTQALFGAVVLSVIIIIAYVWIHRKRQIPNHK